jgi:Flp pilus assembly protein TadG
MSERFTTHTAVQRRSGSDPTRGQSLLEFAVVLPIALMLFGGIVQYGVAYAAHHTLIQIGGT